MKIKQVKEGPRKGQWRLRAGSQGKIDKYFPTKTEGDQWYRSFSQREQEAAALAEEEANRVWSLGELFDWVHDDDKGNVWKSLEKSTRGGRKSRFEVHVRTDWGHRRLNDIDPIKFQEWINKVERAGVGAPTVEKIRTDLVTLWNTGVKFGQASRMLANPFQASVTPAEGRKVVILSVKEAIAALNRLTGPRKTFFALGILGGLRVGEIQAFQRTQIQQNFLLIDRAVKARPERIDLPKKDKIRQAVLCATLKTILESHTWDGEFCFRQQTKDNRLTKTQVYAFWSTIVEQGKLPREMHTHDMRANHINWIEKLCHDVSDTTLQEHVGHGPKNVTQTNYTRPLTASQAILASAIDRLVEDALSQADTLS